MPVFVVPSSNGEDAAPARRLREQNDCHDPKTGQFAAKGAGHCAGAGALATSPPSTGGPEKLRRLVEQNPDFDIDEALDAGGPGFRAQYDALQAKIPDAQNHLMASMTRVLGDTGAQQVGYTQLWDGSGPRATVAPPKGARRLIEKAALDYGGDLTQVKDPVRAAIAVDSPDDVPRVRDAVRKHFDVVREKDRFAQPVNGGYRDLLFNVKLRNGVIGEVQVHVKPLLKAKETRGHQLYTEMRRYMAMTGEHAKQAVERLQEQSLALYASAWSLALAASVHQVPHGR